MNAARCEADALRRLTDMPFLDRLELAALSGWSRGAVYDAVSRLEERGMVEAVPHASPLVPPTRRHALTATGLERLAELEGKTVEELLFLQPLSRQWRRGLLERLDAVAVIYRLACAINQIHYPLAFRWYRAMPLDAALVLPDGRSVAVVRQGNTSDRTAFAKRLWRLGQLPPTSAVQMLLPDEVRLRQARRLATALPGPVFLALESDAASAGAAAAVWRTPSGPAPLDLQTVLSHTDPPRPWPLRKPPQRAAMPDALQPDADCLLPSSLRPVEKRAVDLLADWPWLAPQHLGELLGVKRSRLSQVTGRLAELSLLLDANVYGQRRLALSDRGLVMLARRDRDLGGRRPQAVERPAPGRRRPPALAERGRNPDSPVAPQRRAHQPPFTPSSPPCPARLVPAPGRLSNWTRPAGRPATSGTKGSSAQCIPTPSASSGGATTPGPSSWSGSAGRCGRRPWPPASPPTCATTPLPGPPTTTAHQPLVLVVFDDDIALTHFLAVAAREMERARVRVPLLASHRELVEGVGPLGRAWIGRSGDPPDYAFRPLGDARAVT